ncbi:MAG: GUN4 domain-containing protein [Cyanobacteria bacterium J06592_8]
MSDKVTRMQNEQRQIELTQSNVMALCPVCQTGYHPGNVSSCLTCGWDVTPCPPEFQERYNHQAAWARRIWERLQGLQTIPKDGNFNQTFFDRGVSQVSAVPGLIVPSTSLVDLHTEREIDYTHLEHLLRAGQWREADEETTRVMLVAAERESAGYLDLHAIRDFPCVDIYTINQLWLEYSRGHFGFSVQKQVWQGLLNQKKSVSEDDLGDLIGWRSRGIWLDYDEMRFDLQAPVGHLPVGFAWWVVWWCISLSRVVVFEMFERLEDCEI